MNLIDYLPSDPNGFYEEDKGVITVYVPKDIMLNIEEAMKKLNIQKLSTGSTDTTNLSNFMEDIIISWFYSHTNLSGLDDYIDLSSTPSDRIKTSINIHKPVISLIKIIAVNYDASPSLVVSNALSWWVLTH